VGCAGPGLRRQQPMAECEGEPAGEPNELATRSLPVSHGPLFIDGCVPPIDMFENNNNIKRKKTKVDTEINAFIYFRFPFLATRQ
jgi:hypothetical protein